MKAHKREVPRCLERTSAARRKEENLCLHEDIISSRIRALITAKKRRTAVSYSSAECCLERTNFARTKNRTAAGTSLKTHNFEGKVTDDYAECLHFYPRFAYGRIIAGQSRGVVRAPRRLHLPAVRVVSGIYEGVPNTAKNSRRALRNEKSPPFQGKQRGSNEKHEVNTEKW